MEFGVMMEILRRYKVEGHFNNFAILGTWLYYFNIFFELSVR